MYRLNISKAKRKHFDEQIDILPQQGRYFVTFWKGGKRSFDQKINIFFYPGKEKLCPLAMARLPTGDTAAPPPPTAAPKPPKNQKRRS